MSEYIFEFDSVTKIYPNFNLKPVSFKLPYGHIMGLIGPNGAGKTTIIKLMMNLIKANSGTIKIFGQDYQNAEVAIKDRIGFVYEDNCYNNEFKAGRMKDLIAPFYSRWDDAKFRQLANQFKLDLGQRIGLFSRGQKVRFALAMALSHNAELLILDEPTSGADPVFRADLAEILREEIADGKKSVLFSTHITTDLEKTADFITMINDGTIMFNDTLTDLQEKYWLVKGGNPALSDQVKSCLTGCRNYAYGFEALTSDRHNLEKLAGNALTFEKPNLEQIMVYLCKEESDHA